MTQTVDVTHSRERVEERIRDWKIVIQDIWESPGSILAFGNRDNQPVVLKVIRQFGDEWRSGEVLNAFDGRGMVRVYQYVGGAVLLERLSPGTSLATMVLNERDDEATEIIAGVIERMAHPRESLQGFVTVEEWGRGFDRYRTTGDHQVPNHLIDKGEAWYKHLCATQRERRVLHGDLQHYNILFDERRGWVAIDPKGVVGELEYEIGASLRNPVENPEWFTTRERIESRVKRYENKLKLDAKRVLGWGFAQAVLSVIWTVEDGLPVDGKNVSLMLANAIEPMLE